MITRDKHSVRNTHTHTHQGDASVGVASMTVVLRMRFETESRQFLRIFLPTFTYQSCCVCAVWLSLKLSVYSFNALIIPVLRDCLPIFFQYFFAWMRSGIELSQFLTTSVSFPYHYLLCAVLGQHEVTITTFPRIQNSIGVKTYFGFRFIVVQRMKEALCWPKLTQLVV